MCEVLSHKMKISSLQAQNISERFLKSFRNCPEKIGMSLNQWRSLLWVEALGPEYEEFADFAFSEWKSIRYQNLKLDESTHDLLKLLKKTYQLGLITNGTSKAQWEKIRILEISGYFDIIMVSGDMDFAKPQEEIFYAASSQLGVEAYECMMVGDKLETDIAGALNARLGANVWIPIKPPAEVPAPKPDFVIQDLSQLLDILDCDVKTKYLMRKHQKLSYSPHGLTFSNNNVKQDDL